MPNPHFLQCPQQERSTKKYVYILFLLGILAILIHWKNNLPPTPLPPATPSSWIINLLDLKIRARFPQTEHECNRARFSTWTEHECNRGRINLNVDRETEHECNRPRLKKQPWSNDNLYSVIVIRPRLPRNEKKKTAEGVAKYVTEQSIRDQHYKKCLLNKELDMTCMRQLRSYNHNILSINLNKIGLSPYDDKRYILSNGRDTLGYGHYSLRGPHLDENDFELIELLTDL